jgi:hypothetical protein
MARRGEIGLDQSGASRRRSPRGDEYLGGTSPCDQRISGGWLAKRGHLLEIALEGAVQYFRITYPNGYVDGSGVVQRVNGQLLLGLAAENLVFKMQ